MEKLTLVHVQSGTIDLVWNGIEAILQFNANCVDCLPYCKAMCCRSFSIGLDDDEKQKFTQIRKHPFIPNGAMLLRNEDRSCVYLQDDCKCGVHNDKPRMCKRFACSPGCQPGDETITRRDAGWKLEIFRREAAALVERPSNETLVDSESVERPEEQRGS